eukprot:405081-Ditylum_brightwellii.AAC.1
MEKDSFLYCEGRCHCMIGKLHMLMVLQEMQHCSGEGHTGKGHAVILAVLPKQRSGAGVGAFLARFEGTDINGHKESGLLEETAALDLKH